MKRVAIVVEGHTEEEFVKRVLRPHLMALDVAVNAIMPKGQGGNISVDRLAPDMAALSWNFDAVTSLVDFYGFKGKQSGDSVADIEERINSRVMQRNPRGAGTVPLFAYVQRHEFEALLFSGLDAFNIIPGLSPKTQHDLERVAGQFASPEDINDGYDTAPSKRIVSAVPNYRKRLHGPEVAKKIGLEAIRAACPRFHTWVERLESLEGSR